MTEDTLWLSPEFGPTMAAASSPFPAERLVRLRIPVGERRGSNFGLGILIGGLIGVAAAPTIFEKQFSSSTGWEDAAYITSGLLGAIGGGILGTTIKKNGYRYQNVSILGDPTRLRNQRERLERLRWRE